MASVTAPAPSAIKMQRTAAPAALPAAQKRQLELPLSLIRQNILPFAPHESLVKFYSTSKMSQKLVTESLRFRTEMSWKELFELQRMKVPLSLLSSLKVICGECAE